MEPAWIRMVDEAEATDFVRSAYEGFIKQRGWVPPIMKVHSLRPNIMRAAMQLVNAVMYDPSSGLTRAQREMIATVVSVTNRCHY
ncbi:MAG: carboxymuconolactone decarboxylase family protein [Candidatus Rokuibacteriota bacterium]